MDDACQSTATEVDGLPIWAVDPRVRKFLSSQEFDLFIMLDEKYKKCVTDKPLIVIRRSLNEFKIKDARVHIN